MNDYKTAGIIIIGNEILSGKVRDVNSFFLACELRKLGVDVKRVSIISDEIEEIGNEAFRFSETFDYVFTSGGVGPTHDDVTMAGIAKGFGVPLKENREIKSILRSKLKIPLSPSILKMTMLPEGSTIHYSDHIRFPVVSFRNIFIFPGIPEYVRNKFSLIKEKLGSSRFFLKKIYLNCHESGIAEILNEAVEKNKEVIFGSYPVLGQPDYRVMVTAESRIEGSLDRAMDELMKRIPQDIIVRIE